MNPALSRSVAFVTGVILALIAIFAAVSALSSSGRTAHTSVVTYDAPA